VYPAADDPEAYVDGWPVWRVVLEGPIYRFRVWGWALRHRRRDRARMVAEIGVWVLAWVAALREGSPAALRGYVLLAEIGTWAFPLVSVTGVHDRHAAGPLRQTRTLRARCIGPLMLGMQYHLEHHLYPRVPSWRLAELARALDPWLAANDAAIWGGRRAR
jgi:beta-carotene hydroxylase